MREAGESLPAALRGKVMIVILFIISSDIGVFRIESCAMFVHGLRCIGAEMQTAPPSMWTIFMLMIVMIIMIMTLMMMIMIIHNPCDNGSYVIHSPIASFSFSLQESVIFANLEDICDFHKNIFLKVVFRFLILKTLPLKIFSRSWKSMKQCLKMLVTVLSLG